MDKRHFTKDNIQVADNHMKRYSTSSAIREVEIKTAIRCPYILPEWPKKK